jgi:hypothetical protein
LRQTTKIGLSKKKIKKKKKKEKQQQPKLDWDNARIGHAIFF